MHTCFIGSVAIVNWNSVSYLRGCLQALKAEVQAGRWRVIVVDNGSADGSARMVREEFPEVALIANDRNAGFAAANNDAFLESSGRYFLLLNPDTEVEPEALSLLVGFMDAHPEVGATAPLLLNPDGTEQRYCNRFPSLWVLMGLVPTVNRLARRTWLMRDYFMESDEFRVPTAVDQPAAACLMVRRDLFRDIGMMDRAFPIYFNDVDLCRRILKAGHRIFVVPSARVVHHGGKSSPEAQDLFAEYWMGIFAYARKHLGIHSAVLLKAVFMVDAVLRSGWAAARSTVGREGKGAGRYRTRTAWRTVRGVRLVQYEP